MMMKKMTLRGKITILTIGLVIVVGVIAGYFLLRDPLVFKEKKWKWKLTKTSML